MQTRIGQLQTNYSARGNVSFVLELWHDGLKKHRSIRDANVDVIKRKAQLQVEEWDERWDAVTSKREKEQIRYTGKRRQEELRTQAKERSDEAQTVLDALQSLLSHTLSVNDAVNWDSLTDRSPFPEGRPTAPPLPHQPTLTHLAREPLPEDSKYLPRIGVLDMMLPSRKARKRADAASLFASDHSEWSQEVADVRRKHSVAVQQHEEAVAKIRADHVTAVEEWTARKAKFESEQLGANLAVSVKKASYERGDATAVGEYCDLVLSRSEYPDFFPQEFDLQYEQTTRVLVVDYQLPAPEDIPTLKSVRYVAARDQLEEQQISESTAAKLYDDVLYQVTLRTIHELFEADLVNAIDTIVFNGIVEAVDRRTGKEVTACILSIRTTKTEFAAVNLAAVDPKACFKALKGVGSAKLVGLSPVAPIMPLNRDDSRFIAAHAVAHTLDDSVNLASMDWEEFEHLIRELFAQEFASNGGEVKVTQASRDGGVDAIAFDPDPIRGGKIVIQAKRYTNTVSVSAVRDLYGTVLNEGATKGILVTTSDYGNDSYTFAHAKPLVLLNGSNLLHLLEKHGHRARIDIKEAKSALS